MYPIVDVTVQVTYCIIATEHRLRYHVGWIPALSGCVECSNNEEHWHRNLVKQRKDEFLVSMLCFFEL